jgi:NADH:ubiquinone reductase (H+-translocating)
MRMGNGGNRRPRVVVVGGGFAGLSAVREFSGADVDVLLLDRNLYNTFQPLLYQVATGGLNPGDVTYALRAFAARHPNAQFRRMAVSGVDAERRCVRTDDGEEIGYEYLVLCCGVTANYFGIPGAQEHARTVYIRKAAIEVRDRMLGNLEAHAQGRPEAVEPVIVIVGAGATGVEMAGALAELRNTALPVTYPELDLAYVRVVLVEMTDQVLGPFAPRLRRYTAKELRKRGGELRLGTAVKEVHPDGVVLSDGERLPSAATIWATGVKVYDQVAGWGLPPGAAAAASRWSPTCAWWGTRRSSPSGTSPPRWTAPCPSWRSRPSRAAGTPPPRSAGCSPGSPPSRWSTRTRGPWQRSAATPPWSSCPGGEAQGPGGLAGPWVGLHIVMLVGHRNRLAILANLSVRYLAWPGRLNVIVGDPP